MNIQPLGDRVVVKRVSVEETKGGIIIPDTAKEKPKSGEIISVGPGKRNEQGERVAMNVKAGDKVLFESYAGTEVSMGGEDFLIMRESEIIGIVE